MRNYFKGLSVYSVNRLIERFSPHFSQIVIFIPVGFVEGRSAIVSCFKGNIVASLFFSYVRALCSMGWIMRAAGNLKHTTVFRDRLQISGHAVCIKRRPEVTRYTAPGINKHQGAGVFNRISALHTRYMNKAHSDLITELLNPGQAAGNAGQRWAE
jgi:hypothetical protein